MFGNGFRAVALGAAGLAMTVACGLQAHAQTPPAGKTQLTVYTSLQKEVLAAYEEAFRKAHPDIQIGWVRDAGGVIHARLLAERQNPRADVIFGLPVTDILSLEREGMIERYAPKGYENLKPKFKDGNNPPIWTGIDMYLNVICFNTVEAKKRNLPRPERWSDLAKPVYKGQIAMPNPAAAAPVVGRPLIRRPLIRRGRERHGRASRRPTRPRPIAASTNGTVIDCPEPTR